MNILYFTYPFSHPWSFGSSKCFSILNNACVKIVVHVSQYICVKSFSWTYSKGWDCWVVRYAHYLSLCDNVKLSYKVSGQIYSSIYGIEVCVCVWKIYISPLNYSFPILDIVRQCSECTVQFSHSVMSNSLQPNGLQQARRPCPSPTPEVYSNSCPLSRWCHPAISSSVIPFSSHFQSFPASGSFQMSKFFASGGQSISISPSTSVLPMNIQDRFPLGLTGWIYLQSKGLWRVFSNTTVQKHQFFGVQLSL